jgi:hypothetical protein
VLPAALLLPTVASAQQRTGTPLGATALEKARSAWTQGEFEAAEPAYLMALEKGGLPRDATLECYIKLGAIRGILGKKDLALAAFRTAALLDASFVVPPEAGKKTIVLADTAKAQQQKVGVGPLKADPSAPAEVDGAAPFAVNVMLDPAHAAVITRLALSVFDGSTGKTFRFDDVAQSPVVHFRVPAAVVLPGARLVLHVDALDVHDNVLAEGESRVTVRSTPVASDKIETPSGGTSFWATPWPYVIGGILLAGAAVGGYFLFRPPSEVAIGAASIEPR